MFINVIGYFWQLLLEKFSFTLHEQIKKQMHIIS